MFTRTIGQVSDSSAVTFNRQPFLEIEYPIPKIMKNYNKKRTRNTEADIIKVGLNFYDEITEIKMKTGVKEDMSNEEKLELINLLKGGVIYNGS